MTRAVRRSDGTFTCDGVRFELPWQYRTLGRVTLRVARWDLSSLLLIDPRTGAHLTTVLPLDKARNADGQRRLAPAASPPGTVPPPAGIAPHLRRLMADYAATGLPPAYLPKDDPTGALADLDDDGSQPDNGGDDRDPEEDHR